MLLIIIVDLLALFSAWLIGRGVFSSLEDKPAQAANSQALLVALISFALIQIAVAFVFGMFFGR
jgi:hypothetical protein